MTFLIILTLLLFGPCCAVVVALHDAVESALSWRRYRREMRHVERY